MPSGTARLVMPTPQSSREAPTSGTGREEEGGCSKWRSHPKVQTLARTQAGVTGPLEGQLALPGGSARCYGEGQKPCCTGRASWAELSPSAGGLQPRLGPWTSEAGSRLPSCSPMSPLKPLPQQSSLLRVVWRHPTSLGCQRPRSTTPRSPVSALHTLTSATDWGVDRDQVSSSTAQSAMDCRERHSPAWRASRATS